jgi:hypothetical protein
MADPNKRIIVVYERVSTDCQDLSRQAVQRERACADHPEAELGRTPGRWRLGLQAAHPRSGPVAGSWATSSPRAPWIHSPSEEFREARFRMNSDGASRTRTGDLLGAIRGRLGNVRGRDGTVEPFPGWGGKRIFLSFAQLYSPTTHQSERRNGPAH